MRQAKLSRRRSLTDFDFYWPSVINADQVRALFTLGFLRDADQHRLHWHRWLREDSSCLRLIAKACEKRKNALFNPSVSMINEFIDARKYGTLSKAIKRSLRCDLLAIYKPG